MAERRLPADDWEGRARRARLERLVEVARREPELGLAELLERFGYGADEREAVAQALRRRGVHRPGL